MKEGPDSGDIAKAVVEKLKDMPKKEPDFMRHYATKSQLYMALVTAVAMIWAGFGAITSMHAQHPHKGSVPMNIYSVEKEIMRKGIEANRDAISENVEAYFRLENEIRSLKVLMREVLDQFKEAQ